MLLLKYRIENLLSQLGEFIYVVNFLCAYSQSSDSKWKALIYSSSGPIYVASYMSA